MQNLLSHNRRPDLTFYSSGRIDISSRVVNVLNIQPGDVVSIAKEQNELFLYVIARDKDVTNHFSYSGRCFLHNKASSSLRAQSSRLCNEILRISKREKVARLPAGEPIETAVGKAIPIITQNALNHE